MRAKSPSFISTPSAPLEDLKHKFLAALYRNDIQEATHFYNNALEHAQNHELCETNEKYLRQMQAAAKQIALLISKDRHAVLPAPLRPVYNKIQTLLRNKARQILPRYQDYASWKAGLDLAHWQKALLFRTAVTFQMTSGCSNFCRRCNEWALPRVRGHFTKEAALKILHCLLEQDNTDLALYGGSDPLDWEDGEFSLENLLVSLCHGQCPELEFSLLTKIPRGKESRLKHLIEKGIDVSISLTNRNRTRVVLPGKGDEHHLYQTTCHTGPAHPGRPGRGL